MVDHPGNCRFGDQEIVLARVTTSQKSAKIRTAGDNLLIRGRLNVKLLILHDNLIFDDDMSFLIISAGDRIAAKGNIADKTLIRNSSKIVLL